jgi:hypothetical protein
VTEGAAVDPAPLRDFALELADVADAISLDHFGGPIPSVTKPDGTPVTEADRAIEAALRERIEHDVPRPRPARGGDRRSARPAVSHLGDRPDRRDEELPARHPGVRHPHRRRDR